MTEEDGPICAYLLDGRGGWRAVGWSDIAALRATVWPAQICS